MLTTKQHQDISLNVTKAIDLPLNEWLNLFPNAEYIQAALLTPQLSQVSSSMMVEYDARKGLNDKLNGLITDNKAPIEIVVDDKLLPQQTTPHVKTINNSIERPDIIITSLGELKSLEVLKRNLLKMYPYTENLDELFVKSMKAFNLKDDITYLHEPLFTNFIISMKDDIISTGVDVLGGKVIKELKIVENNESLFENMKYGLKTYSGTVTSRYATWSDAIQAQKVCNVNMTSRAKVRACKLKVEEIL